MLKSRHPQSTGSHLPVHDIGSRNAEIYVFFKVNGVKVNVWTALPFIRVLVIIVAKCKC